MTQMKDIDIDAMEREGLTPIRCRNRNCTTKPILALESEDGNTLHYNNNARTEGTHGYVKLTCDECNVTRDWRPRRGAKPMKSSVSEQGLKSS